MMTTTAPMTADETVSIDDLRSDLVFQLKTSDELDWDYFLETAIKAKMQADKEGRNNPEFVRSTNEIIVDAIQFMNRLENCFG